MKDGSTISSHTRNERAWNGITRHIQKKRIELDPLPAKLWEMLSKMLRDAH
jgi:hypothetical protein